MRHDPLAQRRSAHVAALAALLLAGCAQPEGTEDRTAAAAAPAPAPRSSEATLSAAAPATVGGDGSAIVLTPLSAAEIDEAGLSGELGCSFSTAAASPLLVAMGDVASRDAAQGVVKVGSYVERVAAPGGFDALLKGVTFSGLGKTIRIDLTGPATDGGESPPRPATLTYDRADGARLTLPGRWSCGP